MVLRGSSYSNTLGMETGITVITPNNYGQTKSYKVCYVLHGICGGNGDYANYTQLPLYAYDKDIIFVCPEVQRSFYTNMNYGFNYFDYVSKELPETVKLVFNVSAKREDTAIIGGSMGGYGALRCALTYPESYGFCGALAPACMYMNEILAQCRKQGKAELPDMYAIFGEKLEDRQDNDLLEKAKKVAMLGERPKFYCCCGESDSFTKENRRFADDIQKIGLDYTYEEIEGQHDLWFFGRAILRALDRWRGTV